MLANKAVIDLRPTIKVIELDSIVGPLLLGVDGDAICFLEFLDTERREQQLAGLSQSFDADFRPGDNPVLTLARRQLTEYFAGTRRQFDLPLRQPGTPFQSRVWQALTEIPYGATCSYGDIARNIGQPQAMRAVGMANGRNHRSLSPGREFRRQPGRLQLRSVAQTKTARTGSADKRVDLTRARPGPR
jgi:O6-methylguanine-DNA--protein-cysteine methyltransferase